MWRNICVGALMKLTRIVAFFVLAAGIGMNGLNAKTLRSADGPAEFPPASYKGSQYVDSRGCVFIRAGIDGNVTWVPRVSRSRQQLCGAAPSIGAGQAVQTAAAAPSKAVMLPDPDPDKADAKPAPLAAIAKPKPVTKPKPPVVARAVAPAPRPAPLLQRKPMKTVASITTAPKIGQAARPMAVQPVAPRRMIVPQTMQAAAPVRRTPVVPGARVATTSLGGGCAGLSPYAQQSLAGVRGARCGPQGTAPVSGTYSASHYGNVAGQAAAIAGGSAHVSHVTPHTRVTPKHVYEQQAQSVDVGRVPNGYRRVWTDDRLNNKRAHQTLEGRALMEQRWTRTVPRRLKPMSDARPGFNPDAVYPTANAVTRNSGFFSNNKGLTVRTGPQAQSPVGHSVGSSGSRTYVSSKSVRKAAPVAAPKAAAVKPNRATPKPAARAPAGHRYVQVGAFASDAAARSAISRLHGAGLAVRKKVVNKNGKQLQVIVTGPYRTSAELGKALSRARRAGFGGAFTH